MALTADQRREQNRRNAQKSTGPKTSEGKARSRGNALRHGLRAEVLPLPGEDPEAAAERAESWRSYYRPGSPAAEHLVTECARASLMADRLHRHQTSVMEQRLRTAEARWDETREDEVAALAAELASDPAATARRLWRTAEGCRWVAGRWDRLIRVLDATGTWFGPDLDEATRLLGYDPDPDPVRLKASPQAYRLLLLALLSRDNAPADALNRLCDPEVAPEEVRPDLPAYLNDSPASCRDELRSLAASEADAHRARAERLHAEHDLPDRAGAADRALLGTPADAPADRLFLRYQAESRTAFHRAYSALVKTLDRDAAAGDEGGEDAGPLTDAKDGASEVGSPEPETGPPALVVEVVPVPPDPSPEPVETPHVQATPTEHPAPEAAVSPNEADSPAPARPRRRRPRFGGEGNTHPRHTVDVLMRLLAASDAGEGPPSQPAMEVAAGSAMVS